MHPENINEHAFQASVVSLFEAIGLPLGMCQTNIVLDGHGLPNKQPGTYPKRLRLLLPIERLPPEAVDALALPDEPQTKASLAIRAVCQEFGVRVHRYSLMTPAQFKHETGWDGYTNDIRGAIYFEADSEGSIVDDLYAQVKQMTSGLPCDCPPIVAEIIDSVIEGTGIEHQYGVLIPSIKRLREGFRGTLGLKDSKDIVHAYLVSIDSKFAPKVPSEAIKFNKKKP